MKLLFGNATKLLFGNMSRSKYWWITLCLIMIVVWSFYSISYDTNYTMMLILTTLFMVYNWCVAFARLRDIGLVTWFAAVLIVLRFVLVLVFPLIEIITWIVVGFIPTGAASGRVEFVERYQPKTARRKPDGTIMEGRSARRHNWRVDI